MTVHAAPATIPSSADAGGFTDAAAFGFSPAATGVDNQQALQRAVDQGGTVIVSRPGTYRLAGTVYLGNHTTVEFGNGVVLMKVDEQGPFSHVLLNRGALTKTWNTGITVIGLTIAVNGIDVRKWEIFGLHGQLAFFYVKDLRIERFRCADLGRAQYAIHICTFEDLIVNDVIIAGGKDGVHLGRGKRFRISNGVFRTLDDAVALNAHDYDVGNPELGWIEDGVVENCHDLNAERNLGFFARILGGGWSDWRSGMEVQKSDTVVSDGRLYRVRANPDGTVFRSTTQPTHTNGIAVLDGITWVMVQAEAIYTAGVRRVTFRDIFLENTRTAFSIHFDNDWYSRSYYPGSPVPHQEQLTFDGIRVAYEAKNPFLSINTPVDVVTITNSTFRDSSIIFTGNQPIASHGRTVINVIGCTFAKSGALDLVVNEVTGKAVDLRTIASVAMHDDFSARTVPGPGTIAVRSDLPGLAAIP